MSERIPEIRVQYSEDPFRRGVPWIATFDTYDGPESPIGMGNTAAEAVEALLEAAGIDA
jgi:hypothetical protein